MEAVTEARLIYGRGTSEQTWQRWMALEPLRKVELGNLLGDGATVHIVAPHPDDEVLGCAGIIQQAAGLGVQLQVWAVTDGEASHKETSLRSRHELAICRTRESETALSLLNPGMQRTRLLLPDGHVAAYEAQLADRLSAAFGCGDTVIAPWHLDGHPDHESVSRASRLAAQKQQCRFLEVPIWGWHWVDPFTHAFPAERAVAIDLSEAQWRLKMRAIQVFQSQLQPDPLNGSRAVMPWFAIERFARPYEVVFR